VKIVMISLHPAIRFLRAGDIVAAEWKYYEKACPPPADMQVSMFCYLFSGSSFYTSVKTKEKGAL